MKTSIATLILCAPLLIVGCRSPQGGVSDVEETEYGTLHHTVEPAHPAPRPFPNPGPDGPMR